VEAALRAVRVGLIVLAPESAEPKPTGGEPLTQRERQVLALLAEGAGNKEIAARLGISDHTVKYHLASVFGKLGVSTRTEAVTAGVRRGWIML